jgi:hypothetical protein
MARPEMARIVLAACLASLLLLATGCGVGSSDEGDISAATQGYLEDLAAGDFGSACGRLVEPAQTAGCAGELEQATARQPRGAIDDRIEGRSEIEVDGDTASVGLEGGGVLRLQRTATGWRIASGYPR